MDRVVIIVTRHETKDCQPHRAVRAVPAVLAVVTVGLGVLGAAGAVVLGAACVLEAAL